MSSSRSINALLLFARRAIALCPSSLTGSAPIYRSSSLNFQGVTYSLRWFTQEAKRDGFRYRNRTKNFKQDQKELKSTTSFSRIDEQLPSISFSPEELVPNRPMLERIVNELKMTGTTFILPKESELLEEVLKPFKQLYSNRVKTDFILRICIAYPSLFNMLVSKSAQTMKAISSLVTVCKMSYEDVLRLFASFPELSSEHLDATLDTIISCGVPAGSNLGALVKRCPPLFFGRPLEEIQHTAEALADFFSRKQIALIVQRCPDVLLKNIDETEEKYQYIFYQMGFEGEHFIDCSKWGSMPLEEIIMRHQFLVKCGRFTTPDDKHPQIRIENPSLKNILDTSEENFANQIAQVTREEWIIYRALCVKENEMSKKEHAFIRVKPSMRKAYERRRKEANIVPEHVFDVSSSACI